MACLLDLSQNLGINYVDNTAWIVGKRGTHGIQYQTLPSQGLFANLCVDAIIELGTKDGTSAESVEFVCVDDESEDVVVTGGVVVDEDVDDEGVHSTNVDRDDIDDVDDDDVDEG